MWPPIRNVTTFSVGTFILLWEVVHQPEPRPLTIAVAMALMGVLPADRIIRRLNGRPDGNGA